MFWINNMIDNGTRKIDAASVMYMCCIILYAMRVATQVKGHHVSAPRRHWDYKTFSRIVMFLSGTKYACMHSSDGDTSYS